MTAVQTLDIPSVKDQVSEQEWKLRVDLAALYRLVALYGWEDLSTVPGRGSQNDCNKLIMPPPGPGMRTTLFG